MAKEPHMPWCFMTVQTMPRPMNVQQQAASFGHTQHVVLGVNRAICLHCSVTPMVEVLPDVRMVS
jgi:hypothetical protein